MGRILGTVKAPLRKTEEIRKMLSDCGVENVEIVTVSYETFTEESRLNYDCAYPEAWSDGLPVAYINFEFTADDEGRNRAFGCEYNIMQIPLNLRYDFPAESVTE